MNDFYVVLPSNACPEIHPDNDASKFFVTFNQCIDLNPSEKWKVALTEVNYNSVISTLDTNHGVEYSIEGPDQYILSVSVKYDPQRQALDLYYPENWADLVTTQRLQPLQTKWVTEKEKKKFIKKRKNDPNKKDENKDVPTKDELLHYVMLFNEHTPFILEFYDTGKFLGFPLNFIESVYVEGLGHATLATNPFNLHKLEEAIIKVTYILEKIPLVKRFTVEEAVHFTKSEDLFEYLQKHLKGIVFEDIKLNENGHFMVKPMNLVKIKFLQGLNLILGFIEDEVPCDREYFTASYKPYLNRGLKNILIYSSIAAPIHVGGVMAPLLKHITLEDEFEQRDEFAEQKHIDLINPMYIPVGQTTINTIEVNIRSDSGTFIPFTPGSITTLVLHFKKNG
jgi:hypothetical protein